VTETFRRPAAVISIREDFAKGSVRSFGGKDVLSALRASASVLLGFGGHKHAAGLSLNPDQLDAFARLFDEALSGAEEDVNATPLMIEGECQVGDLDIKTLQELENLGPFGPGNPEPVFTFRAHVTSHRVLKDRHLKLRLGSSASALSVETECEAGAERERGQGSEAGAERGRGSKGESCSRLKGPVQIEAIWFHAAPDRDIEGAEFSVESEWAGVPELNRFRGQATPTFRIRDWRPLNA
jgi:single-stranded DNA-specific DHH superfamily exonuclease